jgi:endo-1,3-1,4-beta-glycanase ExoK
MPASIFTYTNTPQWDEIDIEFVGKLGTTKIQLNYFFNGVGGNEKIIDLGFDASLDFHFYGFSWNESCIMWFVDRKLVFEVSSNNLPTKNGMKIIFNMWNGIGLDGWLGKFNFDGNEIATEYNQISYYYNVMKPPVVQKDCNFDKEIVSLANFNFGKIKIIVCFVLFLIYF